MGAKVFSLRKGEATVGPDPMMKKNNLSVNPLDRSGHKKVQCPPTNQVHTVLCYRVYIHMLHAPKIRLVSFVRLVIVGSV